jgi:hypothetical protein
MGGGFGSKFGIGVEGRFAWELAKENRRTEFRLLLDRKPSFRRQAIVPVMCRNQSRRHAGCKTHRVRDDQSRCELRRLSRAIQRVQLRNVRTSQREVRLNAGGPVAFRAPGHPKPRSLPKPLWTT